MCDGWRQLRKIAASCVKKSKTSCLTAVVWSGTHEWIASGKIVILKCFCVHNERTNTHTHTRIVCVVCFYFPPQNNVSMLLKWIFFALLFNASQRIKLCRLDAMNLYSRSRHKRHHVNIQTHIAFNFHFIFCSSSYYSSSSAASLFFFYSHHSSFPICPPSCWHECNTNTNSITSHSYEHIVFRLFFVVVVVYPIETFNDENREMFIRYSIAAEE